jgi:hypothetical protein
MREIRTSGSVGAPGSNPRATRRSGSRGGNRNVRYRSALGSVQETAACLDVAMALGYVETVDPEIGRSIESLRRVLVRLVA